MSCKEILTEFMDLLGFTEISDAFEFITENNFTDNQIRAITKYSNISDLIKEHGLTKTQINALEREFKSRVKEKEGGLDINSLFEDNNITEDLNDEEVF